MKLQKLILFFSLVLFSFTGVFCKEKFFPREFESDSSIERVLDTKLNSALDEVGPPEPDFTKAETAGSVLSSDERVAEPEKKTKKKKKQKKVIPIDFAGKPLVEVINEIARARGVNVILPTGVHTINSAITLSLGDLPIKKAWKLLYTIVDVAGYSLLKEGDHYKIVKSDDPATLNASLREPLPIYIGVPPDQLPESDKKIRYLYYLSNIQVPESASGELHSILSLLLTDAKNFVRYFPDANGMLLIDKASNIRAAMEVVLELDKAGFKQEVEILKLTHSSANTVASLFMNQRDGIIPTIEQQRPGRRGVGWRGKSRASYFAKNTRIIAEDRTNSLIILGTRQAINRIRSFIFQYIDVRLDSGNSILHTYKLKYLDAHSFAETLTNIIRASKPGATGQATGKAIRGVAGPERVFQDVRITTDTPRPSAEKGEQRAYAGSNQLVIACSNDDWIRIKKLIDQLDKPQPQVIIEILIADLEVGDQRALGAHTRTPAALNLPNLLQCDKTGVTFQSAQIGPAVADSTEGTHVDLMYDDFKDSDGNTVDPLEPVGLDAATAGSTVISLSDCNGEAWSLLQILQNYSNTKILSHPHVVATNNKMATVVIGETRLVRGKAKIGTGGAPIAPRDDQEANLTVTITPRITGGKIVNMQVTVDFDEWVGNDTANQITRKVITNANVQNGSILALGGLIKVSNTVGLRRTPILGQIPIIGWLFKRRAGEKVKNNLTVFIRPTIIEPRLRGGIDKYTKDYIKLAKEYAREGMLFDTLREPITRWFFKTGVDTDKAIDVFAAEGIPEREFADSFAKNDLPAPRLQKDDRRTVLAAIEGRGPIEVPEKTNVVEPVTEPLLAQEDEPDFETVTIAKVDVPVQKQPSDSQQVEQELMPVFAKASSGRVDRDEQLKKLLSQLDNPLVG